MANDVETEEILGEGMSENMKKELIIKASLCSGMIRPLKDMIFLADRRTQYPLEEFMKMLTQYGIRQAEFFAGRNRLCPLIAPQPYKNLHTLHAGHLAIQDNQVPVLPLKIFQHTLA